MALPGPQLVQIVDAALTESTAQCGRWLVCRPGCWDCCRGPFEIGESDAQRLRAGLAELERSDPDRAARIRDRAHKSPAPDDADHDEPCPALDPESGACDLYEFRPITCRLFGPPIRWGSNEVGICELCFDGASNEEIAACTVYLPVDPYAEQSVLTTVAEALKA